MSSEMAFFKRYEIPLVLGNRPLRVAGRLPNLGESQNLMPPKTLEFVEILLDLARPAPGASNFHEIEDELFHGECRLTLIEGGPDSGTVRRQSSKAEDVAVPRDPAAAIGGIDVTNEP